MIEIDKSLPWSKLDKMEGQLRITKTLSYCLSPTQNYGEVNDGCTILEENQVSSSSCEQLNNFLLSSLTLVSNTFFWTYW